MPFDYKKEYKEFYQPPTTPVIVTIPPMQYLAVRGAGNPNEENGAYQAALGLLYATAFTLKMSRKSDYQIDGYFDYVVPPLEGFWWQDGISGADMTHKDVFRWISLIRLPDFVSQADFEWAIARATQKKKLDCSKVERLTYDEGLCVQCMHLGCYDNEPETIRAMAAFAHANGHEIDITPQRFHHEIYLSDPRKTELSKRKTVLRHPLK